jgi:selenocysteine-specific elongation factor
MGPSDWKSITELAGLELNTLEHARVQAIESGQIIQLAGTSEASVVYLDAASWGNVVQRITQELEEFHGQYKLRHGMSVEELRSRLQLDPKVAGPILNQAEMQGVIDNTGRIVRLASFQPELDKKQHLRVESLLGKFRDNPFSTPSVKESIAQVGEDVLRYLLDTGELIQLSEDVLLTDEGYEKMLDEIKALFAQKKTITVAEVRDHLDTSRKYVLAMLEHLDTEGITKREGDLRMLV